MLINGWKKDILTIPNILSIFRLLLIPVYTTMYLRAHTPSDYFYAAGILSISCITDLLDGIIARRFHQVSTLGKILDPLADKVTQCTLIFILIPKSGFLTTLAILFVCKETFQLVAAIALWRRGKILKGALLSGKICTTVIFSSMIAMVMLPNMHLNIINTITLIDLLFMSVAFLDSEKNN